MRLNLPILNILQDCQNILIAGAGGGFDVFIGLPIYFTLREMGKTVHLANYSAIDPKLDTSHLTFMLNGLLLKNEKNNAALPYFPENALMQQIDASCIWVINALGVIPVTRAYTELVNRLNLDAIILVDGGIDSLMRGDEERPGTLLEDAISLAAVHQMNIPIKILACLGFGTESDISHYRILENIATLAKTGAFWGCCALTSEMEAFQFYESACCYVWEQDRQPPGYIHKQITKAVNGEFGSAEQKHFISPLMSLYWFFDLDGVAAQNELIPSLRETHTLDEALSAYLQFKKLIQMRKLLQLRLARSIPY